MKSWISPLGSAVTHVVGTSLGFVCFQAAATPPSVWIEPVTAAAGITAEWVAIPGTNFFEIPVSRLAAAQTSLADQLFVRQENGAYFGRRDFACSAPSKLYLVRALYSNGGSGVYRLFWAGTALVVAHESLGQDHPPNQSALLACLSMQPTTVLSALGGAR